MHWGRGVLTYPDSFESLLGELNEEFAAIGVYFTANFLAFCVLDQKE